MKRVVIGTAIVVCAVVSGVASASPGASASTGTWLVQAVPQPNRAQLDSVSCPAESDCTAVAENGAAEQWNGSGWTEQNIPNGAITAVSCAAAADCTAVGSFGADHWDGTSWTSQAVPLPAGAKDSELDAVSCQSTANCTATGFWIGNSPYTSRALAEHWDGTSWTRENVPLLAGADSEDLSSGLSCPTATRCIAVGEYRTDTPSSGYVAARWNGSRWTVQTMTAPADAYFRGLSCPVPSRCTAVGATVDRTTGTSSSLVEYWDGATWTVQPDAAPAGTTLTAVSCPAVSSCTAVGEGGPNGVAEVWNGTSWTDQVTPEPHGTPGAVLEGVSCRSASHCTAVGNYGRYGHPLAEHEN